MKASRDGVVGVFQNVVALPPRRNIPSRMLFDVQKSYAVYGMKIVIQDLLQNFCKFGSVERFEIFTMPQRLHVAREAFDALHQQNQRSDRPRMNTHDYLQLLRHFDEYAFTQWFDPAGNFWAPAYLRNLRSRKLYPITTLHHTLSYQSYLSSAVLPILLSTSYSCDSLVCTSRSARAAFSALLELVADRVVREHGIKPAFSGRLDIIPLGVDTDLFCPRDKNEVRKLLDLPQGCCILLYLGRISMTDKGDLIPLLRVLRDLVAEATRPDLLLVIAGGQHHGSLNAINHEISALNLTKHVRIVVAPENRHLFFSASDIFVSPSDNLQESFGLTVIEAMASGLPQVVSDWDGYRDTVEHGRTGFLVPTYWAECDQDLDEMAPFFQGDFEFEHGALAQSVAVDTGQYRTYLAQLIANQDLRARMATQSRVRALETFAWPVVTKQYEALWAELSSIASKLPFQARKGTRFYAQPAYYQVFAHYATRELVPGTKLAITPAGVAAVATGQIIPKGHGAFEFGWLQEDQLMRILMALKDSCAGRKPTLSFGGIVELISSEEMGVHSARRHVLWLVKYGLIQICEGAD